MILKALYDYYNRCGDLPMPGMEEKEIGFIIVLSKEGRFVRFEDCRTGKSQARTYLVKKHVGRSSAIVANYLYDNSTYVLGYADMDKEVDKCKEQVDLLEKQAAQSVAAQSAYEKAKEELKELENKRSIKEQSCLDAFKNKLISIFHSYPDSYELSLVCKFYQQDKDEILSSIKQDSLWEDIKKNLSKKYSTFSFRIEGDLKIIAEKRELLQLDEAEEMNGEKDICLITGNRDITVDTTSATMIPGSQATAKLVAFQVNSGYDSYGKKKCGNAPISKKAEFAYTTSLNAMLQKGSHNKFSVGNRTFVFWASSNSEAAEQIEGSLFDLLGYTEEEVDDPNAKIEQVRKVFTAIYSGSLKTSLEDRFYILGLAPNSARIAVVYWSECSLKEFAGKILCHFKDMEIKDTRKDGKPYMAIDSMLSAVTRHSNDGKWRNNITPNLTELCLLTDANYQNITQMKDSDELFSTIQELGQQLCKTGPQNIIVTGIHFQKEDGTKAMGNLLINRESASLFSFPYVSGSYSGTGDLFASCIAAGIARGDSISSVIQLAGEFLELALLDSVKEHVPCNDGVNYEQFLCHLGTPHF